MGLSPEQFYTMRLKYFFIKLHGFRKEQEQRSREHSELVRMQTVELVNIQLPKEDKIKDPVDLWRFSWEEETEKAEPVISEEQGYQNFKKMFDAL